MSYHRKILAAMGKCDDTNPISRRIFKKGVEAALAGKDKRSPYNPFTMQGRGAARIWHRGYEAVE